MNNERRYLWRLDEKMERVVIEIHHKDGVIQEPSFSVDELSSKEEVEERIKEIETNLRLKENEQNVKDEQLALIKAKRLKAFGTPPKKPVSVNVEDRIRVRHGEKKLQ